jgi:hypothetical protein
MSRFACVSLAARGLPVLPDDVEKSRRPHSAEDDESAIGDIVVNKRLQAIPNKNATFSVVLRRQRL